MWPFSRLHSQRYCAFCKSPRRVYVKKHIGLTNVLAAVAFAVVVTYAVWSTLDPQGLPLLCVALICAEIFVYMRWRMNVVCNLCGFDPVLYKRSKELAAARVREFFQAQVENPGFWLSKSPLLKLQKSIRTGEKKSLEIQQMRQRAQAPKTKAPVSAKSATPLAPDKTL